LLAVEERGIRAAVSKAVTEEAAYQKPAIINNIGFQALISGDGESHR
jgi:hypothetical protein